MKTMKNGDDKILFDEFLRHRETFQVMLGAGIFDIPNGKATLNFHEGRVQNIMVERRTYQHINTMQSPRIPI